MKVRVTNASHHSSLKCTCHIEENSDITLKLDFDSIIENVDILKTNEYF